MSTSLDYIMWGKVLVTRTYDTGLEARHDLGGRLAAPPL